MQRDADSLISNNDRQFILKALQEESRLDGRTPYDFRKVTFQFSLDDSSATVRLGQTTVMTVITAQLEAPYPDRPNEGSIRFNVEFSPMASPAFESSRPGEDALEVARLIERGLKQSQAIDQEALCVVTGRKVWSLRVDTHVLDHGGNLVDAAFLSALAACMVFRKPEVTVGGGTSGTEVVVHSPEVKEPLPLTIHHRPVSVTFALFEDGNLIAVDPSLKEEAAMDGNITVMVNSNKEICAVHKPGGCSMSKGQFERCVRLACARADELVKQLKAALDQHEVARVQARVRRHHQAAGSTVAGPAAAAGLPSSIAAPAAASNLEDELARELGIELNNMDDADMDDDEEEQEEEAGQEEQGKGMDMRNGHGMHGTDQGGAERMETEAGLSPADGHLPSNRKDVKRQRTPMTAVLKGVLPQVQKSEQQPAAAQGPSKGSKTKHKRVSSTKYDELEMIAAVIAGATPGAPSTGEVPDLAAAVKKSPKAGKKLH